MKITTKTTKDELLVYIKELETKISNLEKELDIFNKIKHLPIVKKTYLKIIGGQNMKSN